MSESVRNAVIGGFGAIVLGALVLLTIKANAGGETELDSAALAKAQAAHKRGEISSRDVSAKTPPRVARGNKGAARKAPPAKAAKARIPPIPRPRTRVEPSAPRANENPELEKRKAEMAEANRFYDRGDYEGALQQAEKVLKLEPDNVRMLRVAVSSHCIFGNQDEATSFYEKLPDRDQRQMARRCKRYGVEFAQP